MRAAERFRVPATLSHRQMTFACALRTCCAAYCRIASDERSERSKTPTPLRAVPAKPGNRAATRTAVEPHASPASSPYTGAANGGRSAAVSQSPTLRTVRSPPLEGTGRWLSQPVEAAVTSIAQRRLSNVAETSQAGGRAAASVRQLRNGVQTNFAKGLVARTKIRYTGDSSGKEGLTCLPSSSNSSVRLASSATQARTLTASQGGCFAGLPCRDAARIRA